MCVDRLPCCQIRPTWVTRPGNRYLSYPALRVAFIQSTADPEMIYVVSDERLPETLAEAAAVVETWSKNND